MAARSNVFISYAADTKPRAQELTQALEKQGIEAWVDFKDLRPGQRWRDELERAVGDAHWLLILVGPGKRSSALQEAEWSTALASSWADSEKRLLPVIFGEAEPPPFLRNWVSLRVHPDKEPATWTSHVLDAMLSVRDDTVPYLSREIRREREERFDEMTRSAEKLRDDSPFEPEVRTE